MTNRIIAVDSGKDSTKAGIRGPQKTASQLMVFKTTKEKDTGFGEIETGAICVRYEGEDYIIGKSGMGSVTESKADDLHKICIYTAIAKLVEYGDSVILGIGCPLIDYLNPVARKAYANFIKGNGVVDIAVNGEPMTFNIREVYVFPEGSGPILYTPKRFAGKQVGIIDIGGLNVNGCRWDNCSPIRDSAFTLARGYSSIRNGLRDELNMHLPVKTLIESSYKMDDIMRNGYVSNRRNPEVRDISAKIIKDYYKSYVEDIYRECQEKKWNVDEDELYFIGGTSLFLKETIKEVFYVDDNSFFEDAIFLNVEEWLRVMPSGDKNGNKEEEAEN